MEKTTYRDLCTRLAALYDEGEAKAIVRLMAEKCFGLSLTDLLCDGFNGLTAQQTVLLHSMAERLLSNEPVQYVLGEEQFYGREFHVEPGVLIPRPETELLCQWVIQTMQGKGPLSVLDIGTGSGCIAITLALELPDSQVTAWDISAKALEVASQNAEALNAKVALEQTDILQPPHDDRTWDVVVSNPPYVTLSERATMHPNVLRHEPAEALFVSDEDPQTFYRAIARYAWQHLSSGGHLFFECSTIHIHETARLLTQMGYTDVSMLDDQFDKPRHLKASRP